MLNKSLSQESLIKANIAAQFGNNQVFDELEKGKKANLGEIREWGGKKYRKEVQGWVGVNDGEVKHKMEEGDVDKKDAKELATEKKGGAAKNEKLGIFDADHAYAAKRVSTDPAQLTSNVKAVLNNKQLSTPQKVEGLFKEGLHVYEICNVSGTPLSACIDYLNKAKRSGAFGDTQPSSGTKNKEGDSKETELNLDEVELPEVTVDDRWNSYQHFGMMIALKQCRAMFAYGSGGVGKTFTLLDDEQGVFSRLKLRKGEINPVLDAVGEDGNVIDAQGGDSEDSIIGMNPQTGERFLKKDKYDYITVTGKVTPTRMFELMQEHNGKLLVFDDCDAVLQKGDDGVNVLKGALDTSGDGTISWEGKGSLKSGYAGIKGAKQVLDSKGKPTGAYDLPKTFKFTGQVVFISNMTDKDVPQPIRSRSLMIDLTMNRNETLAKVKQIAPNVKFKSPDGSVVAVSSENRQKAVDFMEKYITKIPEADLNMRTFQKIALTYETVSSFGNPMNAETVVAASLFPRNK